LKKLIISAIFIVIAGVGFMQYSKYHQQQLEIEQSLARMEKEKAALKAAQSENSVSALNRFIDQHPDSEWLEKAIYERDKLAYHQATETKQIGAVASFIEQYPQSQWVVQAKSHLLRMKQEQKLLDDMAEKQQQLEIQRQQLAQQQQKAVTTEPKQVTPKQTTDSKAPSSRDRVARALSIYQKQRQQEQAQLNQKQKQDVLAQRNQRRCLSMKDQIDQYTQQRVRWYELDSAGERIYLSSQQIASKRKTLQQQYQDQCQ
jgi:hypothetical protein